jgi:hypothetical protein
MMVHHLMLLTLKQSTLSVAFATLVLGHSLQGDQVSRPFMSCGPSERRGLPAKVHGRELLQGIMKLS